MNIELNFKNEKMKLFGKNNVPDIGDLHKRKTPIVESLIKIGRRISNGCEACYVAYGHNEIQTSYSLLGTRKQ